MVVLFHFQPIKFPPCFPIFRKSPLKHFRLLNCNQGAVNPLISVSVGFSKLTSCINLIAHSTCYIAFMYSILHKWRDIWAYALKMNPPIIPPSPQDFPEFSPKYRDRLSVWENFRFVDSHFVQHFIIFSPECASTFHECMQIPISRCGWWGWTWNPLVVGHNWEQQGCVCWIQDRQDRWKYQHFRGLPASLERKMIAMTMQTYGVLAGSSINPQCSLLPCIPGPYANIPPIHKRQ